MAAVTSHAAIIHVPAEQPTIKAGVNAAVEGDTVVIACGVYHEQDIVLTSGICLSSETREPGCVTIDGDSLSRVFYCRDADSAITLIGLAVVGGAAIPTASFPERSGGGLYCENSTLVLRHCVFSDNVCPLGIATYGGGAAWISSSVTLEQSTFSNNRAWNGAGISCDSSTVLLDDCLSQGNRATGLGGGISMRWSTASVAKCLFESDTTEDDHAGAAFDAYFRPYPLLAALSSQTKEEPGVDLHGSGISRPHRSETVPFKAIPASV